MIDADGWIYFELIPTNNTFIKSPSIF
jgi:hypothetical protein